MGNRAYSGGCSQEFEARQTMTTTSAGDGPSAGDGRDGDDGGWGWFTPATPNTEETDTEETHTGGEAPAGQNEQAGQAGRATGSGRPARSGAQVRQPADGTRGGAEPGGGAVGPVVTGAGAGRARWAETPEEFSIPVPAPPGPDAPGAPGGGASTDSAGPQRANPAPAPGAWSGGGTETAREHPAPSPYSGPGGPHSRTPAPQDTRGQVPPPPPPQAPPPAPRQAPPRPRSQPEPQPPSRPQGEAPRHPPHPPRPSQPPHPPQPAQPPHPPGPHAPARDEAPPAADVGSHDSVLIRRTLDEVEPHADAATAYFYALLFVQQPQLRDLFPASMDSQRDRLFRALLTAVRLSDEEEALAGYLAGLGRGHRKYGTLPEHYPAVGECLLGALAQYAPESWGQETEDAWVRAYTTISQAMIDAAAEDAQRAPAWWNAQIVSHELRTSEIAVITLRPDQPYPFLAGQYTSVETPWWPRVWRHYSFASSPRSDGLISFHVKAVPTGWVSSALVHRARPGDVLRIGPPAGSMTVDHVTDSGLLCVGGGTGIAPIRALVEDVAEHGRARPVEVFYGARSDHDLYDLETMMRLEQQHRWLSVRPVVASPPGSAFANALPGQLPDAVRQHGPWSAYDGYLSGPPGMIRSGVDALVASGVRADRIRHDSLTELIGSGARAPG